MDTVDVTSCFWQSDADIGSPAAFQVSLICDEKVDISELRFSSLRLSFSDGRPDVEVKAGGDSSSEDFIDLGVVDDEEKPRDASAIMWTPGKRTTLNGQLVAVQQSEVEVSPRYAVSKSKLNDRLRRSSSSWRKAPGRSSSS